MLRCLISAAAAAAIAGAPATAQDRQDLLVTPQWLQQHLKDANLVVLQVGPAPSYAHEHIAGSRLIDMMDVAVDTPTTLQMPAAEALAGDLARFGISDHSRIVVVFSDAWVSPATRIMYTLAYAGLGDRSSLLDGGLDEWKRAGFPVTADLPAPATPGHLALHVQPGLIVDHVYMAAHGATAHVRLVDARSPRFFAGEDITDQWGTHPIGHIAGARNIPFNTVYDDSNRVLPRSRLDGMFQAAGIARGDTVVAYCHVGQQATALLFAARVAGYPIRLYDGSMDDWNKRTLPLVKTP